MKIYYAHSMKIYDTTRESEELELIESKYPKAEIINPAELEYEDMKKYSLDPYIATRQAFYDYRRNIIKKASDSRDITFSNEETSATQFISAQEYIMRTSSRDK